MASLGFTCLKCHRPTSTKPNSFRQVTPWTLACRLCGAVHIVEDAGSVPGEGGRLRLMRLATKDDLVEQVRNVG